MTPSQYKTMSETAADLYKRMFPSPEYTPPPRYRLRATAKPVDDDGDFSYVIRVAYSAVTPVIYCERDAAKVFYTLDEARLAATFANQVFPEWRHEPEEIKDERKSTDIVDGRT